MPSVFFENELKCSKSLVIVQTCFATTLGTQGREFSGFFQDSGFLHSTALLLLS